MSLGSSGGTSAWTSAGYPAPKLTLWAAFFTPDIPQSEIVATNFYERAKFWAKNWAKNWAKFWMKFSGHFRASLAVQNDSRKFLPKFLAIYHSVSWHGSCDWNLKISSLRASGAWGAQCFFVPDRSPLLNGPFLRMSYWALEDPLENNPLHKGRAIKRFSWKRKHALGRTSRKRGKPPCLTTLKYMKGRPPFKKHPNPTKSTVCANNFGTVCTIRPPLFPLK